LTAPASEISIRACSICGSNNCSLKYRVDHFRIVKCCNCGFVYLQNPYTITAEEATYQEYFSNAAAMEALPDNDSSIPATAWSIYYRRIDLVKKLNPSGRLLEIGCGRGYFLSLAQKNGYTVQGIEIAPDAACYAREKFNINVQIGDMENMDLASAQFDIITLWHVLEHFYNPVTVLRKVYTMLDENGFLLIEVPNLNSIKFRLANDGNRWVGGNHPHYHLSFFTYNTLARILLHSGFRNIKLLTIDYSFARFFGKSMVKRLLYKLNMDSFLTVLVRK